MAALKETIVEVPAELVRKSCGLALDIGASAAKIVYRTKENLEEAQKPDCKFGHLNLVSISAPSLPLALQHVGQRALVDRDLASGLIYSTGLGCTLHGKAIGEALGLQLESVPEFDSFVRAFIYLTKNMPRSSLLYHIDESRPITTHLVADLVKSIVESGQGKITGADLSYLEKREVVIDHVDEVTTVPVAEAEKEIFPCVLFVCGSSNIYLKVNEDETYKFIDGSTRGGLNFYGLGSLLTGAQTFEELMELAVNGNAHNVDIYTDEFVKYAKSEAKDEDSMYTAAMKQAELLSNVIYGFGKCPGKKISDFSREDLARALLDQFILDFTHTVGLVCSAAGIKRCFFSGSFVGNQLVRDRLTEEMDKRNLLSKIHGMPHTRFDFLKPGGHLGALGALIAHYNQFSAGKTCKNGK